MVIARINALKISLNVAWQIIQVSSSKKVKTRWIIKTEKVKVALIIPIAPISSAKT